MLELYLAILAIGLGIFVIGRPEHQRMGGKYGRFASPALDGGRNWRAVADDPGAARLMGVNSSRVLLEATMLTTMFSAIAGIMATAYFGSMDFGSGLMFGLKVAMIAAIGDESSPAKSALGAALFGFAETFWGAYMPFLWRDLAMFSLLVVLAVLVRQERRV